MKNLRISPFGVGDMLASNSFAVPTYQRSYAWTDPEITNLLTDLSGAIKRMRGGRADTYFIGSIVVVERDGTQPLEVVDGQQRLATISIILAAIRDYHAKIGQDRAALNYDQQFLRSLHVPTGKRIPKLRLNEIDDRCYVQAILEPPETRKEVNCTINSHKRLLRAYELAMGHIESIAKIHSAKESVAALYEFVEFMRVNVQAIRVMVDDEADAFTVFETLNDRHLPLTVADLLKNFLFGSIGKIRIDEAKGNWRQMIGSLQTIKGKKDRIVDFIRQLWGSMHGLVREKELFRDIKSKILDEDDAMELSAALADQASSYAAVLNPTSDAWSGYGESAIDAILTFNALRVERIRPLLLAILNKFEMKEISSALEFLRSASVRIVVCGGINGTIEEKIYAIAVDVHQGRVGNVAQLANAMMAVVPNNAVFEAHFSTMYVTKATLARFYLRELEEVVKGDEDRIREPSRSTKKVTLEHIIPTSPDERAQNWPELSPDLGASLSRRFGNLTLLGSGPNSKLNGKGFAEKLVEYDKCDGIYITKHIARDYTRWGEEEVNDRQAKLAKFAVQRWPIPAFTHRKN